MPLPRPPRGVDWVVRKEPVPPSPPPTWPLAPGSGWLVVFRVATPGLSEPRTEISPRTCTLPEARILAVLGPNRISFELSGMNTSRTSITPPMTAWLVLGVPPGPPKIVSVIVLRISSVAGGMCQSKSPFGPPVPLKANDASSTPPPQLARGTAKADSVSSSDPKSSPDRSKLSRISSTSGLATGKSGFWPSAATVTITAELLTSDVVSSPVMSLKPCRMTKRRLRGSSTVGMPVMCCGRMPLGTSSTVAPVSVQLATSCTSVCTSCQTTPSKYSRPSLSEDTLSLRASTGWLRCTTTCTWFSGML